jgi:hypothetical protein
MMTKINFTNLLLVLVLSGSAIGQNKKPLFASNPLLTFEKYISGVKYANIGLNVPNQEQVDQQVGIAAFYYLAQRYLQDLGFEYVALTSMEKTEMEVSVQSYCEFTTILFGGDISEKSISNCTISFFSCKGDVFNFKSENEFNYGKFTDVEKKITNEWKRIVSSKGTYESRNQLKLPRHLSEWNSESVKKYLHENEETLKPVEGIYERVRLSFEDFSGGRYTVAVVKNPKLDEYLIIYLSGARNITDWDSGELKGVLHKTSTAGFYTVDWIMRDKSLYEDVYCNLDETGISIYSSGVIPLTYKFIRTFPARD